MNVQHEHTTSLQVKNMQYDIAMSTVHCEDRSASSSGLVERLQTSHIPSLPLSKFKGGDCRGYASDDIRMPVPQD